MMTTDRPFGSSPTPGELFDQLVANMRAQLRSKILGRSPGSRL
jgi:hypothetical protein